MSQHDSTPNTFFEQYFEDRLAEMEPYLRNWANTRYSTLDDATRDEALQRTRITLWEQYQADPESWAAKSPRTWTQYAKTVYSHSLYDKKERVINRRFTVASDLESERVREGDVDGLDLLHRHIHHRRDHTTREFQLAELRIDLELAIRRGLDELNPADRDDMRALMAGIMDGCKLCEIRQQHGWTNRRASDLSALLRSVFYETLTGQPRASKLTRGNGATPAELKTLAKLAAQGLGSYRIAAQLGRSPSWAHDHLTKLRQTQRESVDPVVRFATAELGAVVVEGTDWPRERDGENLAPVPVKL
jgi:hypothetical protein